MKPMHIMEGNLLYSYWTDFGGQLGGKWDFSSQGSNFSRLYRKHKVLITGPPAKSQSAVISMLITATARLVFDRITGIMIQVTLKINHHDPQERISNQGKKLRTCLSHLATLTHWRNWSREEAGILKIDHKLLPTLQLGKKRLESSEQFHLPPHP